MTPPLVRIKKLLALATSPFPEEARTAAHKAAMLIKEHKIELYLPGEAPRAAPPPPDQAPMREHRIITSKFEGHCAACRRAYAIGERIAWMRGAPSYHEACFTRKKTGVA